MKAECGTTPAPAERQDVKLIFELTSLCNFSCPYCIREENEEPGFLPVRIVEKVLEETRQYQSVNYVAFTGGEPTLHPEFPALLALVARYGHRFGFVTNGWQFTTKTLAQVKPYREHLARVTFSMDGAAEETHDTLRGRKGSYERLQVEHEIAELQRLYRMPILLAGDHYNPSRFHQCSQMQMREFNIDHRGRLTACCMLSGFRGGTPDTDVIADLHEVSFYEAHRRLVSQIARVNLEKIERLVTREPKEKDYFICTHCLEHYGKVPRVAARSPLPVLAHL